MPVWPINFESELQGEIVRAHSEDDAFHSLNVIPSTLFISLSI